jgi:hypothetical protein
MHAITRAMIFIRHCHCLVADWLLYYVCFCAHASSLILKQTLLCRYSETQPGQQRLAAYQLRPRLHSSPIQSAGPQFSPSQGSGDGNRGNSAVRTPGGRSLHHKLLSPERFKRDPAETRRVADEKQQRAERLRSGLEAERKAKLEKVLTWHSPTDCIQSIQHMNLLPLIHSITLRLAVL